MKPQNENLRDRTKHFALRIIKLYSSLPRVQLLRRLGGSSFDRARRSELNYREASRARSNPEFVSKLGESLKELEETGIGSNYSADSGTIGPKRLALLMDEKTVDRHLYFNRAKSPRPILEFIR